MHNNFRLVILFLLIVVFMTSGYALNNINTPKVNILTWWGYLNTKWVSDDIKKQCNVAISFDEYHTTSEFLTRFEREKRNYDIIIFPAYTFNSIKKEISSNESKLYKNASGYSSKIKAKYEKMRYPNNVVYFQHTITGVFWNPKNIIIDKSDSIEQIFNMTKFGAVILADDALDMKLIVTPFTSNAFRKLLKNVKFYLTNELSPAMQEKDFTFSYQWANIAAYYLINVDKESKYIFTINPNYSYFMSDLLAQLSNNHDAVCVANVLSSREFLDHMQNDTFNFSPYGDGKTITNSVFKKLQKDVFQVLSKLSWLDVLNENELYLAWQKWKEIKLDLQNADN